MRDLFVVPRTLFLLTLPTGDHELSCALAFGGRPDVVRWSCEPDGSSAYELSGSHRLSPAEQQAGRTSISAILPREWEAGVLRVSVRSGKLTHRASWGIRTYAQPASLRLPLLGPVLVVGAHAIGEPHRTAWRIPSQQFGWDLLPLAKERWSVLRGTDDDLRATSFAGLGCGVVSPAPGRVVHSRDGEPDQDVVGSLPASETFADDPARAMGNHVVVDHGDGVHSFLGHLQCGSIRVRAGDQVAAGSGLGSVGASGNAAGPHLHLHFMDGPDVLSASPLPIQLDMEGSRWSPRAGELLSGG